MLEQLASNIAVAAVVFVSTNVDDVVLLSLLFADPAVRPRAVVVGQFLGLGALFGFSALIALLALVVPEGYVALLGAIPLGMGLHQLWSHWRGGAAATSERPGERVEGRPAAQRLGRSALKVMLLTVAGGGDNVSIYVPVFAREAGLIPLYAVVFAVLTAVWCGLGYALVSSRAFGEQVRRYGHAALPVVLIVLGAWILSGARELWR